MKNNTQEFDYARIQVRGREIVVLPNEVRGYARKSTAGERAHKSIDEQVAKIREACHAKGLSLPESCVVREKIGLGGDHFWERPGVPDIDRNGKAKAPRPGLTQIVRDIEMGLVKVLVVYDHTRLWRSNAVSAALVDFLGLHGVVLMDRNGEFAALETPEGRQALSTHAAAAQLQREMTIDGVIRAHNDKRVNGEAVTLNRCLGFRPRRDGTVEPLEEELNLVRRIFAMYLFGEGDCGPMSITAIGLQLNRERQPWPRKQRKDLEAIDDRWIYSVMVRAVLKAPKYIGKQIKKGSDGADDELYDAKEYLLEGGETVVSVETWERAQEQLARNGPIPKRRISSHPMSGLLRCGGCAAVHTHCAAKPKRGQMRAFWRTRTNTAFYRCTHKPPTLIADHVDAYVKNHLARVLLIEVKRLQEDGSYVRMKNRIQELRIERPREEQRMASIMDEILAGEGSVSRQARLDMYASAERRLYKIDAEAARINEQLRVVDEQVERLERVDHLDANAYRSVIRSVLRWAAVVRSPPTRADDVVRADRLPSTGYVLFLTVFGTYHTAIIELREDPFNKRVRRRTNQLRPAQADEVRASVMSLPDPTLFCANLRRSVVNQMKVPYVPRDWTPGYNEELYQM